MDESNQNIGFTNRSLSIMTPFTFEMVKKHSGYFLESDPESGQHSGKRRQYDLNEAFRFYLGADLITFLNYSITEAQHILKDLYTWLESKGWAPMEHVKFWESSGKLTKAPPRWNFKNLFPDLTLSVAGKEKRFGYIIQEVLPLDDDTIEKFEIEKVKYSHIENVNLSWTHVLEHSFGDLGEYLRHVPRVLHLWDIINRLGNGWCQQANEVSL